MHSWNSVLHGWDTVVIKERQKARNQVRKYKTKEQKDEQKLIAKSYTPEIGKLRKELMYCQKIEERSLGINKFLNEHEKQKRRKERTRWKKLNTLKLMDYYIQN